MEKHIIAESILKAVKSEVLEFIDEESKIPSAIEYEQRVMDIALKFASELIQQSRGDLPKSRNDKKKL
jgi:hypothetical protein